jgi:hypothetical protein
MWDEKLQEAFKIIESDETNQREIWKISSEIKAQYGSKGLKEFSDNLKTNFGVGKSYNTLRHYAHIYDAIKAYNIPEDISYPAIRAIVNSGDIEKWVGIINQGISSSDVIRMIYLEKPPKEQMFKCKNCHSKFKCPICESER